MNEPKLIHCVVGSVVSWLLTAWSWAQTHSNLLVGAFAIGASIWTMMAAHETVKLRRKQRKQLEEDDL